MGLTIYAMGYPIHVRDRATVSRTRQVHDAGRRASRPGYPGSMYTLARAVRLATTVAVALLVAGILVHLLGANTSNGIVSALNDAAKWLPAPVRHGFPFPQ